MPEAPSELGAKAGPWFFDGHLDLAWNALQWNRDLTEPVAVLRVREADESGPGRGTNTVSLPDLAAAPVRMCFATALARSSGTARDHIDFDSAAQANAIAWGHMAYYRALERQGTIERVLDAEGLHRHLRTVDDATGRLGVVPCMEGADPVLDPEDLASWHEAGLRMVGLSHYGRGRYAGGTGTSSGLTDLGRELLVVMRELGMILDLTHLSDPAFVQALDAFDGPVVVSHANCRALVPSQRQLSDEQVLAVAERGGVVGAALDAWMLVPSWVKGRQVNPEARLAHVVDHIVHVCELTDSVEHAAIGTDLDGGFGSEQSPADLPTIAYLGRIARELADRGFGPDDIDKVCHGNWVGVLERAWGGGA